MGWMLAVKNGVWVSGLAAALAALSWADWVSIRSTRALSAVIREPPISLWLLAAGALASAGVFAAAGTVRQGALNLALLCCLAVFALAVLRAGREVASRVETALCVRRGPGPRLQKAASCVVKAELWLLLALTPFLVFPNVFTPALLPFLLLPWLARKIVQGRFTTRTPMDWPVLILLLMLPVSLSVSPDLSRSLPKLYGILLGMAVFYGLVNHMREASHVWTGALGMALLGVVVAVLALVGTDWHLQWLSVKSPIPAVVYLYLPRLISGVPGSAELGFHPNEVGAVLCLFVPFAASLLLLAFESRPASDSMDHGREAGGTPVASRHRRLRTALWIGLLLMLGTVVLAGSRSAWVGIGVSLLALLGFRWRWGPLGLVLGMAFVFLALWAVENPGQTLGPSVVAALGRDLAWRHEIWQSALAMIRDYPWTGVGLNAFPLVANAFYPLPSFAPQDVLRMTHAHSVLLQVAVDLGVPGLVAYLAMLATFGAAGCRVYRLSAPGPVRATCVGLVCAMLAYHVYGLTDCMTLGAKPGLVLWMMWGLMAALANLSPTKSEAVEGQARQESARGLPTA